MTLDEIKAAVRAGKVVHWKSGGYTVIDDGNRFLIVFTSTGNAMGLTWTDGVTMNGHPDDFFVAGVTA